MKIIAESLMIIILMILFSIKTYPSIINVPRDFPKIQEAIDAANNGDIILVDQGTYMENINFKGKSISVKSYCGPEKTIIDGLKNRSVILFNKMEDRKSIIAGFTITNGSGTLKSSYTYGGGIYCANNSSPTIRQNVIIKNNSDHGGGISCCGQSNPIIDECYIINNIAKRYGGGIHLEDSDSRINNCLIENNESFIVGGGIKIFGTGTPVITGNKIISNKADEFGGGIEANNFPGPIIDGNLITRNTAGDGAGIFVGDGIIRNNMITYNTALEYYGSMKMGCGGGLNVFGSNPYVYNNVISYNNAMISGGGVSWSTSKGLLMNNIINFNLASGGTVPSSKKSGGAIFFSTPGGGVKVINCIINNNKSDDLGGGIYVKKYKDVSITNCSISKNIAESGGAVYLESNSDLVICNSILYNNNLDEIIYESNMPSITYSNVKGGWPGTGNIDADPLFADFYDEDFHLTFPSPCKDSGDNYAVFEIYDFENDPRITYGTVDMGADEFYTHLYWTGDATPDGNVELKFVGLPGTTPVHLWLGSGVLDPPWPTKYGDWDLEFPLLASIPNMGAIPTDGVLVLPFTFPANTPTPLTLPFQSGIGMELSNLNVMEVE